MSLALMIYIGVLKLFLLKGVSSMENWGLYFFPIFFGLLIFAVIIFFIIYIVKESRKKMRISTYFGLKRAIVKLKIFDTSVMHSLFVFPKRQYEVVYRLETEAGKIAFTLDERLKVETNSRKVGSEIISFGRFKPVIFFEGDKAKNGECSVKIYRRR